MKKINIILFVILLIAITIGFGMYNAKNDSEKLGIEHTTIYGEPYDSISISKMEVDSDDINQADWELYTPNAKFDTCR